MHTTHSVYPFLPPLCSDMSDTINNPAALRTRGTPSLPQQIWATCCSPRKNLRQARDMANFPFWTAGRNPGPERAQVGPTDTIWGQKLVKTQRKGSPNIARVDSIRERGRRTPSAPVLEQPGPVFWWFWAGLGPPRAWPVGARGGPPQAGDGDSGARGWLFGLPGAIWGAAERQRGALFAGPFWARR